MHLRMRLLAVWLLALAVTVTAQQATLGPPEQIAEGVRLYRLDDPSLLDPPGPVAVQALRLDPRRVTLEIIRAVDAQPARDTVETIVRRQPDAIAAINAGFFSLETGKPTGFLKIDGTVLGQSLRPRGAVGIIDRSGVTRLLFDRLVVTTGSDADPDYRPRLGTSPSEWAGAADAVGGAGLLRLLGRELTDWTEEQIATGFETTRHPRTMIGTDTEGTIWFITVDGRNPALSLGMTFADLQRLSRRFGLSSALNLDGGGSTTMWVAGRIVNRPSDPDGPRKVSEAIVVVPRRR